MSTDFDFKAEGDMPVAPRIAGDYTDDDAGYIDDILLGNPNPPPIPGVLPAQTQPKVTDQQKQTGRLISRTLRFTPGDQPVQFLPADPDRKTLRWLTYGGYALMATEGNLARQYDTAAVITTVPETLDGYTGPVWVFVPTVAMDGSTTQSAVVTICVTASTFTER